MDVDRFCKKEMQYHFLSLFKLFCQILHSCVDLLIDLLNQCMRYFLLTSGRLVFYKISPTSYMKYYCYAVNLVWDSKELVITKSYLPCLLSDALCLQVSSRVSIYDLKINLKLLLVIYFWRKSRPLREANVCKWNETDRKAINQCFAMPNIHVQRHIFAIIERSRYW